MESLPAWYKGEEERCDRCGRLVPKTNLRRQDGKRLCSIHDCYDDPPPKKKQSFGYERERR